MLVIEYTSSINIIFSCCFIKAYFCSLFYCVMPILVKICSNCSYENHNRSKVCCQCANRLTQGRPGTTQDLGCSVSSGRPHGTTQESGYSVSSGRPRGTTQESGYSVGSGRPRGTTQNSRYQVGKSGGRPDGSTQVAGYEVGTNGGRPHGRRKGIEFDPCIELPIAWDQSDEILNINTELLDACSRRISQQRTFDRKPLGLAVC